MRVSVCVATRDRAASLQRFLYSLDAALGATPDGEAIVIDNGSSDDTPRLLAAWVAAGPHRQTLRVPQPGKSRALNAALTVASGEIVAFTDDDVEVSADWTVAIAAFFAQHTEYAAAMGRVRLPDAARADPALRALIDDYRTLPAYDRGEEVCEVAEMYGANMAVRRALLTKIGGFDERLGPGVGTACEDLDLARRIRQQGGRIGYMPAAVVCHEVDVSRLTPEYLADFQLRLGRSELVMYPARTYWHTLPRLVEAGVAYGLACLSGSHRRRLHAWGRVVRHADLFRERWKRSRRL